MADAGRQAPAGKDDRIKLRVVDHLNNGVIFAVRKTTKMWKVMKEFSDRNPPIGTDSARRFLFDGRRINNDDTPESLKMESEDVIEVFFEQRGGCQSGDGTV